MCLEVTRVVLSPFRIRKCKTVTSHVSRCCVQCADSLVLLGVIGWQRYTNSRLVAHLKEVSASPLYYPPPPPQNTKWLPLCLWLAFRWDRPSRPVVARPVTVTQCHQCHSSHHNCHTCVLLSFGEELCSCLILLLTTDKGMLWQLWN